MTAQRESQHPFSKDDSDLHALFNLQTGWFLDYCSPVVR